jgi:hypothetical protein
MKQPKRINEPKAVTGNVDEGAEITLEQPDEKIEHLDLLKASREALLSQRNAAMLEGLPAGYLVGYVWDLDDELTPRELRQSDTADEVRQASLKAGSPPLVVGVMPRKVISRLITPVAKAIERIEDNLILSAAAQKPRIVEVLETPRPGELVVVVIAGGELSLHAMEVSELVTP